MNGANPAAEGDQGRGKSPAVAPARDLHAVQPQREIREALAAGQLVLHYQPIVRLDTFAITAVEALLRWNHPKGGTLAPDDFLPSIAQTPVMREVTRHVLGTACADAARWPQWTTSVNVAASDVVHQDFADDVIAAIESSGLTPGRLTLELTEQSVVQDVARATEHLQRLRGLGVGIALDDFGTGYSSLLYLRSLPVTQVKIDGLFVSALDRGDDDAAIVESVVRLAHTINVNVTAEGVETPGQALFLQSIGCADAQGHLFGSPRPAIDLTAATTSDWVGPPPPPSARPRPTPPPKVDAETIESVQTLMLAGASLHTVAAALNRGGKTTPQGSRWSARAVARVVADLPPLPRPGS